jgi:hypothetical protein
MRPTLAVLRTVFRRPTHRQLEAYGRFLHTLSAACLIGSATIAFAPAYPAWQVVIVFSASVVCFFGGAVAFGRVDEAETQVRNRDSQPKEPVPSEGE